LVSTRGEEAAFTKRVEVVDTSVGEVRAIVMESAKGASNGITLLAIHGASPILKYEWVRVAEILSSKHGYKVVMPDFHGNAKTTPKTMNNAVFEDVVSHAFLDTYLVGSKHVVLMGKSWGGKFVAHYAAAPANAARLMGRAVVLAAPAGLKNSDWVALEPLGKGDTRVLLMHTLDDSVFGDTEKQWKGILDDTHLTIKTETAGHHRIQDSYAGYIHNFVNGLPGVPV
jgi:predicted alpha/beta-fold hydrolase